MYAINQETLATAWNFHNVEYQFGNYRLLFEGDTVFFASWNLFVLDKASREPIWKSSYGDISLVHNIALVKDYILFYDSGSDGEVSFIAAAEKNTGERKFYGFTSKSFPPDKTDKKELTSYETESGKIKWRFTTANAIYTLSLVVASATTFGGKCSLISKVRLKAKPA